MKSIKMKFTKLIIAGFLLLCIIFTALIFKLYKTDAQAFYDTPINSAVKAIYTVRGRPLQRSAKLSNDKVIDVPEEFISYIQTGDSIIKESNSGQIILITFQQNSRTIIVHP